MKYRIEFKVSNVTNIPSMCIDCDDLDADLEALVNQYGKVTISLLCEEDKKESTFYVKGTDGKISIAK